MKTDGAIALHQRIQISAVLQGMVTQRFHVGLIFAPTRGEFVTNQMLNRNDGQRCPRYYHFHPRVETFVKTHAVDGGQQIDSRGRALAASACAPTIKNQPRLSVVTR